MSPFVEVAGAETVKTKRLDNGRLTLKLRDIPVGVVLQIKASGKTKKLNTTSIKKGTVKLKVGKKKTLRVKLRYQHPELGNTSWVSFKVRDRS